MAWKNLSMILATSTALLASGCATKPSEPGPQLAAAAPPVLNPDVGAAIAAASGSVPSDIVDPCTLNIGNPRWRDHGGWVAYEERCGHPPPP
jgi:hypothetical protein